jgi:hypothetical protein
VPWYERDGGLRLAQDQAALRAKHSQFSFDVDPETQRICMKGSLDYQLACGVPTKVGVRVEFPADYPSREPRAYDGDDKFLHEADRHFHPDGRCCLWLRPESEWDVNSPDALAHYLDQVVVFFDRQLICEALPAYDASQWPGGARGHGVTGYLEYVEDVFGGDEGLMEVLLPVVVGKQRIGRNHICPCGGSLKYKRCHLSHVEKIRRSLTLAERDGMRNSLA